MTYTAATLERFWSKVQRTDGGCWLWLGGLRSDGYGLFYPGDHLTVRAHRFAYEVRVGPIPKGLVLDHTCHQPECAAGDQCLHRRCVNPMHLEPVTDAANTSRRSPRATCRRGHALDEQNTYVTPDGRRQCRACHNHRQAARRRRVACETPT